MGLRFNSCIYDSIHTVISHMFPLAWCGYLTIDNEVELSNCLSIHSELYFVLLFF